MYNINRSQLIAVWIFGLIGLFFTLAPALDDNSGVALFLMVLIPFVLIFYTLGWRKKFREDKDNAPN